MMHEANNTTGAGVRKHPLSKVGYARGILIHGVRSDRITKVLLDDVFTQPFGSAVAKIIMVITSCV
jgi:hypothetical protein